MAQLIFEFTEKMILAFEWDLRDRWRNSFYTIQICAIPPYIQAKMIGNVVNFVDPYVHLLEWQLRHLPFHFKVGRLFSSIGGLRFMFQPKSRRFLSQRAVPSYGYFGF